jgi:meso-butanediol dehydrogenase/(S,S)-butanediol dehydrogenase/diacetyl reductase
MGTLDGRTAIVTGSGRLRGLGRGIAQRLMCEGANLVVTDVPGELELEEVRDALGGTTQAIPCDLTAEDQISDLIDRTLSAFGGVDILVNNAGIGYMMKPLDEVSAEEWRLVLDVNLTGAFLCTKYAARAMRAQGRGGRIVNVASQAAKSGFPHIASYVASKHGMIGLTRSNAVELAPHGITVNAICPNHVTTDLGMRQNEYFAAFKGMSVEQYLADMTARIPLGRPGRVADSANLVAFLCSDAAGYVTGEAINVSGGEEMH